MWERFLVLLTGWLICSSPMAWAQTSASTQNQHVKVQMEFLEDPQASMTLSSVQAAQNWQTLDGHPAIGFTKSAVWLRILVSVPGGSSSDWRLVSSITHMERMELYQQQDELNWVKQEAGSAIAKDQWPLPHRSPVFILTLKPGTQVLYVRMRSMNSLSGAIYIYTEEQFRQENIKEALVYGSYFGMFAVVILLQLLLWYQSKDRKDSWYTFYLLLLLMASARNSGYVQTIVLPEGQLGTTLSGVLFCLTPAVITKLSAVWLNIDRHLPRLGPAYQYCVYGTCAATASIIVVGEYTLALQISQYLMVFWLLTAQAVAAWLWLRKVDHAGAYLLVFGFIDLGVSGRYLHNLGLLPVNLLTSNALFIGIALHLLAMSLYFVHRYSQLQNSLRANTQAMEEQRDFVSMVSHEFRTPLAIINTSIQQLAANLDAPPEKSLQRARNIRNATARLTRLMDDYLSIDRLDTALQPINRRVCDFYDVIEEATSDWPLERIRITTHQLPSTFLCDPQLMHIALRNLLANADRHSPPESIIELNVVGSAGVGLVVSVKDQGDGIPAEELARLFQKYVRGRNSQGKPGAGLGLYLVNRIVSAHGGTVRVDSIVGVGTTFIVQLPQKSSTI